MKPFEQQTTNDKQQTINNKHILITLSSMKKAFIQLHTAVFLAGFTAILGKLIELNEGLLVWYRLIISVIIIAVVS